MATDTDSNFDVAEFVAAFLLGLAAVAIGWSTFQSALWGGEQDGAYTESVREANNAVDLLQAADTTRTLDQSLFVELLTSEVCDEGDRGDEIACEGVLSNMSDQGAAAVGEWLSSSTESNPFESPAYLEALYREGDEARLVSDQFFKEAGEANDNGDEYDLAATILTAVLFFAGISVVIRDGRISWGLLVVATLLLIGGTAFVASLPLA